MLSALQGNYWFLFLYVIGMTRSLTRDQVSSAIEAMGCVFFPFFPFFFNKHKSFSLAPIFAFLCSLNSLIYSNGVVCNEATTCGKILNKRHKLEHDFGLLFHWVKLWILIQHPPLKLLLFFQGNLWCVPKLSPLVTQLKYPKSQETIYDLFLF